MTNFRAAVVAVLAAAPCLVFAHHSLGDYDTSKLLKLTGKIVESAYENPHSHLRLETKGEGATAGKTWNVVLAPASRMMHRGLEKSALKPGTTATVEGYPNRDKPEELLAERISIGGKTVRLR
jgi:predicted PilT family ATPase